MECGTGEKESDERTGVPCLTEQIRRRASIGYGASAAYSLCCEMMIRPAAPLFWIVVCHRYERMLRGPGSALSHKRATACGTFATPSSRFEQYISTWRGLPPDVAAVSNATMKTIADPGPAAGDHVIVIESGLGVRLMGPTVYGAAVAADAATGG